MLLVAALVFGGALNSYVGAELLYPSITSVAFEVELTASLFVLTLSLIYSLIDLSSWRANWRGSLYRSIVVGTPGVSAAAAAGAIDVHSLWPLSVNLFLFGVGAAI